MINIFNEIVAILNESSVYLLMGFMLAGVLHVVLTRFPRVTAQFTGGGTRPVFMSALLGLPMPLCSCSVLPAAMTLRRKGASKGATASFLISVPETDVVSILLTFALLGGTMAIYRPLAALATALAAGLFIVALEHNEKNEVAAGATAVRDCCDEETPADDNTLLDEHDAGPWWRRALHYGFIKIFDDLIAQLFLGIIVAGILMAWLPGIEAVGEASGAVWTYGLMLVIGVPMYVCAVASTPVAAGLIAGGVSPGAAMVFLLAGPATNIASLFVLKREFGRRLLAVYLIAIAVASAAAGVAFDAFLSHTVSAAQVAAKAHAHSHSAVEIASTVVFLILLVASFYRTRLFPRLWSRLTGPGHAAP